MRELWRRLRYGRTRERGLDDEVRFHLDQQTEKLVRHGLPPEEARRQAFVRFGGVEYLKEHTRDEFRPALLEDFLRDLRYGVRLLVRSKAFAFVSILTLGLGIGAATAVFSVVDGVLLRPLPYPDPDRIVRLFQVNGAGPPDQHGLRTELRGLEDRHAQLQRDGRNAVRLGARCRSAPKPR